MSNKISTALAVAIIAPFGYIAAQDAASIKHELQTQNQQIQQLEARSAELDLEIDKASELKEENEAAVDKIEEETQKAIEERKRLEAELGV